jgi:hypothetical protein
MTHIDVVRKRTKIAPTARDMGLKLTIEVTAFDSGIVVVDGQPVTGKKGDQVWAAEVAHLVAESLVEFARQVQRRSEGG